MKVSAVILAGGRATRLNGEDKGLVLYQNQPLISYVLNALSPHVSDVVISANRHLQEYKTFGHPVVSDGNANFEGPLKGLLESLAYCQQNKVLVTTCDMPFIPNNLISLFDEFSKSKIQVISVNQRLQLCFLMDITLQKSLSAYLESGEKRVMQWIKSQTYQEIIYLEDANHFKNLNTAADFLDERLPH